MGGVARGIGDGISGVLTGLGGLATGLLGGLMPQQKLPEQPRGVDPNLAKQQAELEAQQKRQIEQNNRQLEQQRISALRGRFSGGGGQPTETPGSGDLAAANLFSRITGRDQ